MVVIGPGIWLLGSLWLVTMIVFIVSVRSKLNLIDLKFNLQIRSNNHLVGIGFGIAITLVTIILAIVPERVTDDDPASSEEDQEIVDEHFAIKITYCVLAPLIALGAWAYHGVNELYRPIRAKRVQSAW